MTESIESIEYQMDIGYYMRCWMKYNIKEDIYWWWVVDDNMKGFQFSDVCKMYTL